MMQVTQVFCKEDTEPRKIKTTAYYQGEITATGCKPRKGICATDRAHLGMTAIVYADNNGQIGEILGYWECLDTGKGSDNDGDGVGAIEEGYVVDMYFPTLEECQEWMRLTEGKIFIQYVEADG